MITATNSLTRRGFVATGSLAVAAMLARMTASGRPSGPLSEPHRSRTTASTAITAAVALLPTKVTATWFEQNGVSLPHGRMRLAVEPDGRCVELSRNHGYRAFFDIWKEGGDKSYIEWIVKPYAQHDSLFSLLSFVAVGNEKLALTRLVPNQTWGYGYKPTEAQLWELEVASNPVGGYRYRFTDRDHKFVLHTQKMPVVDEDGKTQDWTIVVCSPREENEPSFWWVFN